MPEHPLGTVERLRLAVRVWRAYALVRVVEWRQPLPRVVRRLARPPRRRPAPHSAARLSRAVDQCLWPVGRPPRCLFSSLTLFRLLRAQGELPELVIGLEPRAVSERAHAWVELAGADVGPPPGRGRNEALGRYP
jgi:hypothetical protein